MRFRGDWSRFGSSKTFKPINYPHHQHQYHQYQQELLLQLSKVLYTGDFSRQPDRHLLGAETPHVNPDVLIVESTYGIMVHEPRKEREMRFTKMVDEVVSRGGRCLLPVFALGRAQELLLILDEYWEAHPRLRNIPIYYASSLARRSMHVFRTYINMMNDKIKKQFDISNPFDFRHILQ